MIYLVYILPLLFAIADALMFRAKTKPLNVWVFNLWLELSKLFYILTFIGCIYLGTNWQNKYIIPLVLIHFVANSIPFNLVSGLKWNYIGVGVFDSLIKFLLGCSVWMWIILQGICLVVAYYIMKGGL